MKIIIKGTEKEIADFVVLLQNQQLIRKPYSDKFTVGATPISEKVHTPPKV